MKSEEGNGRRWLKIAARETRESSSPTPEYRNVFDETLLPQVDPSQRLMRRRPEQQASTTTLTSENLLHTPQSSFAASPSRSRAAQSLPKTVAGRAAHPASASRPRAVESRRHTINHHPVRLSLLHTPPVQEKETLMVTLNWKKLSRKSITPLPSSTRVILRAPSHTPQPIRLPSTANITVFNLPQTDDTYGGMLTAEEASTFKTQITEVDMRRFEKAKQEADEERALAKPVAEREPGIITQPSASRIRFMHFGHYKVPTWHAAPYPEEYTRNSIIYVCEFCLKYMDGEFSNWRHKLKCPARHPPGDEIYRDKKISIFEVDGKRNPVWINNAYLHRNQTNLNLGVLSKSLFVGETLSGPQNPLLRRRTFSILCFNRMR